MSNIKKMRMGHMVVVVRHSGTFVEIYGCNSDPATFEARRKAPPAPLLWKKREPFLTALFIWGIVVRVSHMYDNI